MYIHQLFLYIDVIIVNAEKSSNVICLNEYDQQIDLQNNMINDGFCDCMGNGADEYLTDACCMLDLNFTCKNEGFIQTIIYSSRVNDGV